MENIYELVPNNKFQFEDNHSNRRLPVNKIFLYIKETLLNEIL